MGERGFYAFAERLLAFESGVDPAKFDWYVRNFDRPSMRYWKVIRPGRILRSTEDGTPLAEQVTIRQYFDRIGVLQYFRPNDVRCTVEMQVRSINPWGFVGFQFGECALMDLGYYQPSVRPIEGPARQSQIPSYYSGTLPNSSWRDGVTERLITTGVDRKPFLSTDGNRWQGHFTGKGGICSFSDLLSLASQFRIFVELVSRNFSLLEKCFSEKLPAWVSGGALSGILAACHLTGTVSVINWLKTGQPAADEAGTTIESYVARFSGFMFDLADIAVAAKRGADDRAGPWHDAVHRLTTAPDACVPGLRGECP